MLFGAALLAVLAVWALTHSGNHDGSGPAIGETTRPFTAPTASAESSARVRSQREEWLAYISDRAHDPARAQDFVREDTSSTSCTLVPLGFSPEDRIKRYVGTHFARTKVLDIARVLDKFTGLCVLELRAEQDTGTVLVVRIVSPVEDAPIVAPRVDEGSVTGADGGFTRYVRVTRREGWLVTAGASGPASSGPSLDALLTVAREQSLLW